MPPKKKNKDEPAEGEMVDYYSIMPKKFLLEAHNPNKNIHGLNLPFRH